MNDQEIEEMIKAGVHFGHSKTKRDPAMSQYIFGTRNNVEIIDLVQTKEKLKQSLDFIKNLASKGKTILLVGTQPAAKKVIEETGEEANMPKVSLRWIGGTLTNFKVISKRIETLERLEKEKATGEFEKYTKKERLKLEEKIIHLKENFDGLRLLKSIPDAVFVVNIVHDDLPVKEASRIKIPVIALCDTNSNPKLVAYPIPSNDDALPAVRYMMGRIKEAIIEGKKNIKKEE
ncbi:MAG: 30S ribosomal protein S2 [Candidatus Sungbacteria bacterium RIFCSPLOWO2_12_FULL_41_11]|uniref:Small ribosomal subunit protein uS2 n=1 Tax=Candidatus Sungbacteria bacterium RIFCSPLOWO2_12_FULL_41_11 TaxID=1802286 RepID=A0A1G2LRY2_9BACT|nr:MAG: 30S ribosomal protein S2 [Candidatus Sungbacteria bacterium RIFCSPHIGHO2_02_FULL_41_12b]OHA14400.1 MAG: 30S ribosomal protein S2 [Candidatus Sungbacteria bacterium RIFCSPLOWO2_12_FULL_41_11]